MEAFWYTVLLYSLYNLHWQYSLWEMWSETEEIWPGTGKTGIGLLDSSVWWLLQSSEHYKMSNHKNFTTKHVLKYKYCKTNGLNLSINLKHYVSIINTRCDERITRANQRVLTHRRTEHTPYCNQSTTSSGILVFLSCQLNFFNSSQYI